MTQPGLHAEWAWTQIEAWADGSLSPENRARMEAAIAADPRLAAAQELEIAMRYLKQSARVTTAVGTGLRDAFAATREDIEKDTDETGG